MGKFNNPTQIILVSSRYKNKDNIMAVTWWTKISFQPNLYLISIGKSRFSRYLIKKSKCFVINFMPYKSKEKILFCGTRSGKNIDKFKESHLHKLEGEKINCPVIKESLAFLECKLKKSIETGDHTLFIGEVVNAKFKKSGKRAFQLSKKKFTTTK